MAGAVHGGGVDDEDDWAGRDGGGLSSDVSVLENDGTGFSLPQSFPTGSGPLSVATGDLDGDADLVTADVNADAVSVLRNTTVQAPNNAPVCTGVTAEPATIFPTARDQFRLVTLTGASDPDGDPVTITVTGVKQDEPVVGRGDDTAPDAALAAASNQVLVRAERNPRGNGRAYRIEFSVSDGRGGTCGKIVGTTNATVGVPRHGGETAFDDFSISFDSFAAG